MPITLIDKGAGSPVLLIPGIQGRPEYLRPAIDALAGLCRVVTFSLCGSAGSGLRYDPTRGYDNYVDQIDGVLAESGLSRATLAGVSAGGRIALRYAADRPHRVKGLVLISTPPPNWQPDRRVAAYLRAPRRSALLFFGTSPFRLGPEIRAALSDPAERRRFVASQLRTLCTAPPSPRRMAEHARLMADTDQTADCARIHVRTLVITGERALDRVVPLDDTLQYLRLIEGARHVEIERTGHLGSMTRPRAFALLVGGFLDSLEGTSARSEVA